MKNNSHYSAKDIRNIRMGSLLLMLGLFLVLCFSLVGCDKPTSASSHIPDSPYNVVDTGYWVRDLTDQPAWLDNERILFISTEDLAPGKRPYTVKILNTATGKVISTPLQSFICVRDGQVFYGVRDKATDKVTYYRGPLGKAVRHPNPDGSSSVLVKDHSMVMDTRYDCDWVPKAKPPERIPYRRKLLGKNYLETIEKRTKLLEYEKRPRDRRREQETGDTGSEGKLIYHQNISDEGRQVPFSVFAYSEYLDAYVVGRGYFDPNYAETRSFWILQRKGDLKEVPYPKTALVGRNDIYPVKSGYAVHYSGGPLTEKEGTRGLYLIQGQQVQRLIIGTFGHVSVSPDGCKVAIIHARNIKENLSMKKPYRTLKYINFCQGGTTP